MTVVNDLERAIAMAEAIRGNYLLFAIETKEEKAKKVFKEMAEDMKRHVLILESRKEYLEKHNPLNSPEWESAGDRMKEKKQTGRRSCGEMHPEMN
ncbi:MAG TPA: DUF1657 domain-containing protein [Symbiobacteriaceae bacterium]